MGYGSFQVILRQLRKLAHAARSVQVLSVVKLNDRIRDYFAERFQRC